MRDVDRKRLWGRAASLCAFCKTELTRLDDHDVIVGDEAHIRSRRPDGPRHDPTYPPELLDTYANLILLCKPHHKLVDERVDDFPWQRLEQLKSDHEASIADAFGGGDTSPWVQQPTLRRIADGTEFAELVGDAVAFLTSHVHPLASEVETIAGVLQDAVDWGDISEEIGPAGRVRAAMGLQAAIESLAASGLFVVGGIGKYRHESGLVMSTAVIRIERSI